MRITVYCGSQSGQGEVYLSAARDLGRRLASEGIGLVYGGGCVGLMGVLADAVLDAGGEAIGVIPHDLVTKEVAHNGLTERHVVPDMHTRKAMMADLADAFIAMPGGVGTLEELFEVWTWAKLGYHRKPVGLLNVAGFYDRLLEFLDEMAAAGFLSDDHRQIAAVADEPTALLAALEAYEAPPTVWG